MINVNIQKTIAACMLALFTAACGSPTARVDANYGAAVESIVEGQFYDPVAASNPSTDAVEGTDGQRMEAVMEAHRGETGSAESVSNPIVINVGQ